MERLGLSVTDKPLAGGGGGVPGFTPAASRKKPLSRTAIPLTLSHRLLAELIGARRPTVTTAVAKLTKSGEVARRADGTWLLSREASQR